MCTTQSCNLPSQGSAIWRLLFFLKNSRKKSEIVLTENGGRETRWMEGGGGRLRHVGSARDICMAVGGTNIADVLRTAARQSVQLYLKHAAQLIRAWRQILFVRKTLDFSRQVFVRRGHLVKAVCIVNKFLPNYLREAARVLLRES